MSRRRTGSKRKAQQAHFQKRLVERIGFMLSSVALDAIVNQIQRGEAVHLHDQSHRVKIKGVKYKGLWLVVVYDSIRRTLVTVLPKENGFYTELPKFD